MCTGGGVESPRPIQFTTYPKLRPGSSGPGAAKISGRPTTKATLGMDIGSSDPSEGPLILPSWQGPRGVVPGAWHHYCWTGVLDWRVTGECVCVTLNFQAMILSTFCIYLDPVAFPC